MASTGISTPMRGAASQLNRLSIRHGAVSKGASTSFTRAITTSPSSLASVSSTTTPANPPVPSITPFDQQTVNATIHHFPTLEPLRFETFPANQLYLPTRRDILHRAVVFEGDAARRGTASTKWRDEIRGSSKKIRPQKGSGRARLGDKKSPMLKGGGVAFGPKPRDFSTGLQKKVYDLAWRTALSYRFRKSELIIVDNALEIESPSALLLGSIFNQLRWGGKNGSSLLVTLQDRPLLSRALSTTSKLGRQLSWDEVDVKNILEGARVVIERKALKNILLTHQEDLVRSTHYPKLVQQSEPAELGKMLGWPEFAALETAPQEEQDELKPYLFERLAEEKLAHASTLPPAESTPLMVSAYELLHESLEIKSQIPQRHPDFNLYESEDESERVKGLQQVIEYYSLQAESFQYKAESLRLQGLEQAAEDWEGDADAQRGEADEKQAELDEISGIERSVEEDVLEVEDRKS